MSALANNPGTLLFVRVGGLLCSALLTRRAQAHFVLTNSHQVADAATRYFYGCSATGNDRFLPGVGAVERDTGPHYFCEHTPMLTMVSAMRMARCQAG